MKFFIPSFTFFQLSFSRFKQFHQVVEIILQPKSIKFIWLAIMQVILSRLKIVKFWILRLCLIPLILSILFSSFSNRILTDQLITIQGIAILNANFT